MRFNSRELGVKLAGPEKRPPGCGDEEPPTIPDETCQVCSHCTDPSQFFDKSHQKDCKEGKRSPEKGKKGSYAAGLELLRAQLRESLSGAAR